MIVPIVSTAEPAEQPKRNLYEACGWTYPLNPLSLSVAIGARKRARGSQVGRLPFDAPTP